MQCHLTTALCALLRIKKWKSFPSLPLWGELRMKPLCAIAAGRRARALAKCSELSTWVGTITQSILQVQKWTWMSGTLRWTSRFCIPWDTEDRDAWTNWHVTWDSKDAKERVEAAIVRRETQIRTEGYRNRPEVLEYHTCDYHPLVRARIPYDPTLVTGVTWIVKFRIGAVATAAQLQKWDKLPLQYQQRCPCCNAPVLEDIDHILLDCRRWHTLRGKYLLAILRTIVYEDDLEPPKEDPPPEGPAPVPDPAFPLPPRRRLSRRERSILLLGGSISTLARLQRWLPPRTDPYESDSESEDDSVVTDTLSIRSADGSSSEDSLLDPATPLPQQCGAFRVAAYLSVVMRLRQAHLGSLPSWPKKPTLDAPFRAPGERPGG